MPLRTTTRGVLYGLLAAVSFGVTAPLLKRASAGVGQFSTAALLYWEHQAAEHDHEHAPDLHHRHGN